MMRFLGLALLLALTLPVRAAVSVPPAAQLLPPETLFVLSIPEADKAVSAWNASAYGKLWQDPALKGFRERLTQRWAEDFAGPLERELGVKFSDYLQLMKGQLTVAVTQESWGTRPDGRPAIMLLVDCKDQPELLKTRLAELRKRWVDAGKPLRSESIRDLEFTTLILTQAELNKSLEKAFPKAPDDKDPDNDLDQPDPAHKTEKTEITFGQSGSILLVSNSPKELERILARQAGGLGASLAEQASYEANQTALFRDALAFAWVNFARVYEIFAKQLGPDPKSRATSSGGMARPDKILAASGLAGVKAVAARLASTPEGLSAEVLVAIPETRRQGLFRLLTTEQRDAGPLPFVGVDTIKFKRWRIDGQKAWTTLEGLLKSMSPELAGLVQMGLDAAGKDRDPNFDLRKALVSNLGNDFISMEKSPRSNSLSDLAAPPSLVLVGSAHADQLVQGIKASTALMPLAGTVPDLKEREFLGRRIYSLALPAGPDDEDVKAAPTSTDFNFAASGGYVALSTDAATLEGYLRTTEEASSKTLRELSGLNDAAQKVGGMGTGFFGYENQAETMRIWLDSAKKQSIALDKLFSLAPLAGGKGISPEEQKNMRSLVDVSLLPSFDRIAQYFSFFVYSFGSAEDGLRWKFFAPTPPQIK